MTPSPPPYRYTERAPSPPLADWVLSYWHFEASDGTTLAAPYTVPPDGCTNVVVLHLPGGAARLLCIGPRVTSFEPHIVPGMRLVGMRLWPDTTLSVTGIAPRRLRDFNGLAPPPLVERLGPIVQLIEHGPTVDRSLDAVDDWLAGALGDLPPPESRVRRAVRAIAGARGEIALSEIAAAAHASSRQLQRLFPLGTGLTVSEYARIRRFRESLALHLAGDGTPWSRIAAERGFADHAHLTREFVALTGRVPREVAQQLARIEHRDVSP